MQVPVVHEAMAGSPEIMLARIQESRAMAGEVVHVERIPSQDASFAEPDPPLAPALSRALAAGGVRRLYTHQVAALQVVRSGRDVVVATPTASGKTLVYSLPVLEALADDPHAKALFLFPLKALEQDQLTAINELSAMAGLGAAAAVYDGDTPPGARKKLRDDPPGVIISNPDMVHAAICAYPEAWQHFLANLRYVVIDEMHTYRGIFGSHMAQVMRRLLRLAKAQGAEPRFVLSSATIANPAQHAAMLTGRSFAAYQIVNHSGAAKSGSSFVMINPSSAASTTAANLLVESVANGFSVICFTKSRIHTELIHTWVTRSHPELAGSVAGYRAGFLPEERRDIERALASGRLKAVVSTSALEMGIDIGGLDVCILVGYPGSHINTWQRSGRVGRTGRDSLIFMVAKPDALDQYFLSHPAHFFSRPLESAVLDPDNSHVVGRHLVCAAAEQPLEQDEEFFDLKRHAKVIEELVAQGDLLRGADGSRLFAARQRPQRFVDLRGAGESFTIVDQQGRVVGALDGVRAFKEGYPGAVYLHQTKQYEVTRLEVEQHRVQVRPVRLGYYTRPLSEKQTDILEETGRSPHANFLAHHGRLKVTEWITGYERRRISGGGLMGQYDLKLAPLTFETHGLWVDVEDGVRGLMEQAGRHFMGSIHALEHAAISLFPLLVLSDRNDLGGISIPMHPQTNKAAVFIYDGVPGGVGLAEAGYEQIEELLGKVEELLASCDCEEGCPSCVHSPKCGSGNKPLDKAGALLLVRAMLGKEELMEPTSRPKARPTRPVLEPEPEGGALSFCVMDLETQRLAKEVGGWKNSHLMRVSVAVLYDSRADKYIAYEEREVDAMIEHMRSFDMVVGFNISSFDYQVLSAYTADDLNLLPTLDLLSEVHQVLGYRLSLQALAEATLDAAKGADGLQAVAWWREGNMKDLTDYCRQDVALTRDLFLYGQKHGHLLFKRKKDQAVLQVPMDWKWPRLQERFA